jgi:hypothetical protein
LQYPAEMEIVQIKRRNPNWSEDKERSLGSETNTFRLWPSLTPFFLFQMRDWKVVLAVPKLCLVYIIEPVPRCMWDSNGKCFKFYEPELPFMHVTDYCWFLISCMIELSRKWMGGRLKLCVKLLGGCCDSAVRKFFWAITFFLPHCQHTPPTKFTHSSPSIGSPPIHNTNLQIDKRSKGEDI